MPVSVSPGNSLWNALKQNLQVYQFSPAVGMANREVIKGVLPDGTCVGGMTMDMFLGHASMILLDSKHVYRWQDTLCFEITDLASPQLQVLATRQKAEPGAPGLLANLFCVAVEGEDSTRESLPSAKLVNAMLANQDLWGQLPAISYYARRPVFDANFNLCGPGWHSDKGILVHGPEVEPIIPLDDMGTTKSVLDRLPPFLKGLLCEFCWRGEADLVNALALLLTGQLLNHFVDDPHPIAIIDGNQPGLGKTILVQAVGRILDGTETPRLPLVRDDELEKKLCAQLRDDRSSLFFFDNVRDHIESALIEANALSPLLCFRILGQSATISRPNTYLWVVTSNLTSGTSDFLRRGLPIRLHYEGDPKKRTFAGRPLEYATHHRLEILGELAGMVLRWHQAGMPSGQRQHRCGRWAEVVGGILEANGFNHFLANLEEAEAAMDEGLLILATLAEFVVGKGKTDCFAAAGTDFSGKGRPARDWTHLFQEAEVFQDKLGNLTGKGRDTRVGQFLASRVDRTVEVNTKAGEGTATLRMRLGRSKQKFYWFDLAISPEEGETFQPAGGAIQLDLPILQPAAPAVQEPAGPPQGDSIVAEVADHTAAGTPGGAGEGCGALASSSVEEPSVITAPSTAEPSKANDLDWS